MNGKKLGEQVLGAIKSYVARALEPLRERVDGLERRIESWPAPREGAPGPRGAEGASAYELACAKGFAGTEAQWLQSLKGERGADGKSVVAEEVAAIIERAMAMRPPPRDGADGASAYELAVRAGYRGSQSEWLLSLHGHDGSSVDLDDLTPLIEQAIAKIPSPRDGRDGLNGTCGASAYELAVRAGFTGTQQAWLESLRGRDGSGPGERELCVLIERAISQLPPPHDGRDGRDGSSAYEIARAQGFSGTQEQWLASLRGADGVTLDELRPLLTQALSEIEPPADGASAYEIACAHGYTATEEQWLASLHGRDGTSISPHEVRGWIVDEMARIPVPLDGRNGASAYEIALREGFSGTEREWLASLHGRDGATITPDALRPLIGEAVAHLPAAQPGAPGAPGASAYEIALREGFSGTEREWLASLQGARGERGARGADGENVTLDEVRLLLDLALAQAPRPSDGRDGASAYEIARAQGFTGSEPEWLASLQGARGEQGPAGAPGASVSLEDIAPVVGQAVAQIPRPADGAPGASAYEIARARGFAGSESEWLASLKGAHGTSVCIEEVEPLVRAAFDAWPKPRDGRDGAPGAPGAQGASAYEIARARGFAGSESEWLASLAGARGADGTSVCIEEVEPLVRAAFDAWPKPRDGRDGRSVSIEEVRPIIVETLAQIPKPRDGRDGVDGKSITVEDIREMFLSEQARWALDFERRATDLIHRCIERIEKPRDGRDGRDAFDLNDIELSMGEDFRTLTFGFRRGEEFIARHVVLPVPIYRGVYKTGTHYARGDSVTFGGSTFIAQRDTASKPETDDSWRLAVKRGRDGRDGREKRAPSA